MPVLLPLLLPPPARGGETTACPHPAPLPLLSRRASAGAAGRPLPHRGEGNAWGTSVPMALRRWATIFRRDAADRQECLSYYPSSYLLPQGEEKQQRPSSRVPFGHVGLLPRWGRRGRTGGVFR